MSSVAKDVGKSFIPPGIDPLTWWRIVMGFSVFSLLLFAAWALGVFGGGFASASEVQEVRKTQLEERMDKVYTSLCMDGADQQLAQLVNDLQREYQELNSGNRYEPLPCEILLKLQP